MSKFTEWAPASPELQPVVGGCPEYDLRDFDAPVVAYSPKASTKLSPGRIRGLSAGSLPPPMTLTPTAGTPRACLYTGGRMSVIESYEQRVASDVALPAQHPFVSKGDGQVGLYDFVIDSPKAEPQNAAVAESSRKFVF
jgi:hypothetical protein